MSTGQTIKPSAELEALLKQLPKIADSDLIPENATIKSEFVKCGKPNCNKHHGPYYYAYWKKDGKLHKKYIGKNWQEWEERQIARLMGVSPSFLRKMFAGDAPTGGIS